jgi:hypothetical protein
MMSASSEDVAVSFVVTESKAQHLVEVLHHSLIPIHGGDEMFGPTYQHIKTRDAKRRQSMDEKEAQQSAILAMEALRAL